MAQNTFELVGHEIESPLVNAAGSINGTNKERILREVETLASTALGAITLGSFTIPRQEGNDVKYDGPGQVYYYDRGTQSTYNSMGLPNIGLEAALELMPEIVARAHEKDKPVIVSVSPTLGDPEIGNSVKQSARLFYEFSLTEADLIEINTSCPNIVTEGGGRKEMLGYDLEAMQELIDELRMWNGRGTGLGLKLPPYLTDDQQAKVPELARIIAESQTIGFIVTSNTIPNQLALDEAGNPALKVPGSTGGKSGPSTRYIGREQLVLWREALRPYQGRLAFPIEIISTLGVDSGQEIMFRRNLGAVAAGGVTFLWKSPDWAATVSNMLGEFADIDAPAPETTELKPPNPPASRRVWDLFGRSK